MRAGWDEELDEGLRLERGSVSVVSPFIKRRAAERLFRHGAPNELRVLTRFNLADFSQRVSDLSALRMLLDRGARVRGVSALHSKLYTFGSARAIVTSANLTESALCDNHELGFVSIDEATVLECNSYFDSLWEQAGADLEVNAIEGWAAQIAAHLSRHARDSTLNELPDLGTRVDRTAGAAMLPASAAEPPQAFVKFFATSRDRVPRSMTVLESLRRSGCHRFCAYPKGKRPRSVQDGALMFMGWMVGDPDDILVIGRASALAHRPGVDEADAAEIALRPRREHFCHDVRVNHGEFLGGTLADGISLNLLMDELEADAFATTQEHARAGHGNTDPRRSYSQQAAVRLSREGCDWLNDRLQGLFDAQGQLGSDELAGLDWPDEQPARSAAR